MMDYKKITNGICLRLANIAYKFTDIVVSNIVLSPDIRTIEETIDEIIKNKVSVSRYGDGEFKIMIGIDESYQKATPNLMKRLEEVQRSCMQHHIVCLPDTFAHLHKKGKTKEFANYWRCFMGKYRLRWNEFLNMNQVYYNAFLSRPYMAYKDKSGCENIFRKLKKIWENRDIIIVEGEKSRLGIGNDLFNGAKQVRRILGPSQQAFEKYSEIIAEIKNYDKDCLILLALGPTATVLAYDLSKKGYQAIDIGHVDIEYEWFLMNAEDKVPVKNKYVNEAGKLGGHNVGQIEDQEYLSQIQKIII